MDKLTRLEKVALISLGAGSAFNILLFAMGMTLDEAKSGPWYIIRGVFAIVWFIAFDLTTIATVQAMRDGRRSGWAGATVACSALAAALIGLDVSIIRLPALHAANAIVLPLFMLHLASPRRQSPTPQVQSDTLAATPLHNEVNVTVQSTAAAAAAPTWQPPDRPGFVYVLQSDMGLYKIGRAKDVTSRLQSIRAFVPFTVTPVHVITTTDMYRLEHRLHICFADRRVRGEWFALTEADVDSLLSLGEAIDREDIDDTTDLLSLVVNLPTLPPVEQPMIDMPEIIILKERDNLSFTQIGERLGMTRQAAWQQYKTVKRRLTVGDTHE